MVKTVREIWVMTRSSESPLQGALKTNSYNRDESGLAVLSRLRMISGR